MKPTRREFLSSSLCAAAALSMGATGLDPTRAHAELFPRVQPDPRSAPGAVAPHYLVLLILEGGYDSVLTFDPKSQDEVGELIDCQYYAAERLKGRERLYGPLMAPLLRHESEMCIVHGVRVDTVGHADGLQQLRMGRRRHSDGKISAWKPLADRLPGGAPFAVMELPQRPQTEMPFPVDLVLDPYTLQSLMKSDRPHYAAPDFFAQIQAAQLAQARALLAQHPIERSAYEASLVGAGKLHEWLSSTPTTAKMIDPKLGDALCLVAHAIEHDQAKLSLVHTPFAWFDTHADNLALQRSRLSSALHDVALFIDLLKTRRNAWGALYEQTTLVICTEMGRFPKLNSTAGKDHWPENSWVLLGKGVRRGVTIGSTDNNLRGASVDHRSGIAGSESARPIYVDSLGATVTKICGGDLAAGGYAESDVLWPALS